MAARANIVRFNLMLSGLSMTTRFNRIKPRRNRYPISWGEPMGSFELIFFRSNKLKKICITKELKQNLFACKNCGCVAALFSVRVLVSARINFCFEISKLEALISSKGK